MSKKLKRTFVSYLVCHTRYYPLKGSTWTVCLDGFWQTPEGQNAWEDSLWQKNATKCPYGGGDRGQKGEQMFNALFYKGAKGGSPSNNTLQIFLLRCYFIKSNMILRDASASKTPLTSIWRAPLQMVISLSLGTQWCDIKCSGTAELSDFRLAWSFQKVPLSISSNLQKKTIR